MKYKAAQALLEKAKTLQDLRDTIAELTQQRHDLSREIVDALVLEGGTVRVQGKEIGYRLVEVPEHIVHDYSYELVSICETPTCPLCGRAL